MSDKKQERRTYQAEWARDTHGHKPRRIIDDAQRAEIISRAREGHSAAAIARLTGWSQGGVEKAIARAGGMAALRGGVRVLPRAATSFRNHGKRKRLAVRLLMAEYTHVEVSLLLQLPLYVVKGIDERTL